MKRPVFPYGVRFQENGRIETFPAIEISILGPRKTGIRTLFHIDSGATTSILPESDGDVLGIDIKGGKKAVVRGIASESLVGYRHFVVVQFGQLKIKIPVIFIENILVPRILGREDVFPRFGIVFDESKHRTAFLNTEKERKTIDALFD